jgi:hypothetical protein
VTALLRVVIAAASIVAVSSPVASANPIIRLGHAPPRPPAQTHRITFAEVMRSRAAGWQQVRAASPFGQNGAGTELLMTDGSVMVNDNTSNWYRLIPNKNGDYASGTWKQAASLPAGYGPLYFGSAVLADGKLVIDGGEYNFFAPAESTQGAIYDPVADAWTPISPPAGWTRIGDASSVVLADDTLMLGNCCLIAQALLDEGSLSWTFTGRGKADGNSEEGWTLLPDGKVLTVDVGAEPNSELYNPSRGTWSSAGTLPANLTQAFEIGPQILRPNGTVFVAGASQHTAIYQTHRRTWIAGPDFPVVNGQQLDMTDGPATLLTNGDVLLAASPGVYQPPMTMLVFDGTTLTPVVGPPNAPNDASYNVRLLMLPTGQVLETDGTDDVEVFSPHVSRNRSIAPTISSVPSTLVHGSTYTIAGTLFNGVSQTNAYGDDDQQASNYPLVLIRNAATGHVFYARTHDHSFMGVASTATVTTMFDVPAGIELGASTIEVIANGIPSLPVAVTVD